jgi:hypothetical protein
MRFRRRAFERTALADHPPRKTLCTFFLKGKTSYSFTSGEPGAICNSGAPFKIITTEANVKPELFRFPRQTGNCPSVSKQVRRPTLDCGFVFCLLEEVVSELLGVGLEPGGQISFPEFQKSGDFTSGPRRQS